MHKIHSYIIYLFTFFIGLMYSYSQVPQNEVKAKIELETIEGSIKVTGMVENLTEIIKSATYKLSVIKNNVNNANGNQSTNAQEGVFTLNPRETQKLSVTQISKGDEDNIIVLLILYDENKQIIGKDRVVIGEEKKKEDIVIPIDGFEMKGIVLDDTKTKIGKDFYDKYYYKYNDIGINANKIVTIGEEFSFGRNTKIMITVNNEIVYEFFSRPEDDFIEAVAQESIEATYYYLKELEQQSKYFTQY